MKRNERIIMDDESNSLELEREAFEQLAREKMFEEIDDYIRKGE